MVGSAIYGSFAAHTHTHTQADRHPVTLYEDMKVIKQSRLKENKNWKKRNYAHQLFSQNWF